MEEIKLEDFKKLDIRIGRIIATERIPETDRLIKLMVSFGDEERQIIAGIAGAVEDPTQLIGKEAPFLINLEPKTLRGEESNGMILAINVDGRPVLLMPADEVPPGSPVA